MKTLKLAVAVAALTCLNARAVDNTTRFGVADNVATAAIGGAFGYFFEQQVYLNSRADKSTKLRTLGYGAQLTVASVAAAVAALGALGICHKEGDARIQTGLLALLSAAAVFTYNQKSRAADAQNELYDAVADASAAVAE